MSVCLGMKDRAFAVFGGVFLVSLLALAWAPKAFTEARGGEAETKDPREGNPVATARVLDDTRGLNVYRLRRDGDGEMPENETAFRVIWEESALIFDIRCHESDMENLMVADDVRGGDSVAIFLEPPGHAYYHIEVNPDGKVFDADLHGEGGNEWNSLAEVWSQRGEGFWRVAVRIPVVTKGEGTDDLNRKVVGARPSEDGPWHFNVVRSRVRGQERSAQAFSPTGKSACHDRDKFAKLTMD